MKQLLEDIGFLPGWRRYRRRRHMDLVMRWGRDGEPKWWPGHHCGQYKLKYDRRRAEVVCTICRQDVMPESSNWHFSEKMWRSWALDRWPC